MANELTISGSIKFEKGTAPGNLILSRSLGSQTYTVSGTTGIMNVISVGTSDESLALGDVGTIGYCFFHNLDATNYVSLGADGTNYQIKLKAGEWAMLRWGHGLAAIHAKANTGACNLEYLIIPD